LNLPKLKQKKKLQAKDKKGAMLCLKRKKMYEGEITKIQGARITMEQQVLSLENHSITMETVRTMQQGAQTMKTMRGKMGADDVADLMDDIREEMDTAEELSNELSRPAQELFDDAELLEELNELEELELEEQMLNVPHVGVQGRQQAPVSAINFPSVPVGRPNAQEDEEDLKSLQELQREMALS